MSRIQVARELRKKTLHADDITNLRGQLEELDETINVLVQQKRLLKQICQKKERMLQWLNLT
jgi:chromosome condensin MukBEF ATPase and DNA-binding subunit MukB